MIWYRLLRTGVFMAEQNDIKQLQMKEWTRLLADRAGESKEFVDTLLKGLEEFEDIKKEYLYYMENKNFLGECSVCGMTVVDILIWQTDHFKSDLDRGLYDMQNNPDKMLLAAFDTMIKMKKDPQKYLDRYGQDTGTDYPGKY